MVIISPANVPATPIAESKSNKNIQINMTPTSFVTYIPEIKRNTSNQIGDQI